MNFKFFFISAKNMGIFICLYHCRKLLILCWVCAYIKIIFSSWVQTIDKTIIWIEWIKICSIMWFFQSSKEYEKYKFFLPNNEAI
jgi:hypothetical protein